MIWLFIVTVNSSPNEASSIGIIGMQMVQEKYTLQGKYILMY